MDDVGSTGKSEARHRALGWVLARFNRPVGVPPSGAKGLEGERLWIDSLEAPDAVAPGSRDAKTTSKNTGWLRFAPQPFTKRKNFKTSSAE